MTDFRLAHLSDPHLPPPPSPFRVADLLSKRSVSRMAWRRKHARHDPAVLAALIRDIEARGVDHVAITGDLTNFSTPEEYAAAAEWLSSLGDPGGITVSPGNHDALVRRGAPDRFTPWEPWLGDAGDDDFPRLRRRGPVALLNLSSAVATAPQSAQGRLGARQIADAAQRLRAAEGAFRVLLIHHPPADGLVSRRKSLTDAAELRAMLAEAGAELILHGHAHEPSLASVRGPRGPIPVLGAPSASSPPGKAHRAARWHEISVSRDGVAWRLAVSVRGVGPRLAFDELGSYRL